MNALSDAPKAIVDGAIDFDLSVVCDRGQTLVVVDLDYFRQLDEFRSDFETWKAAEAAALRRSGEGRRRLAAQCASMAAAAVERTNDSIEVVTRRTQEAAATLDQSSDSNVVFSPSA